METQQQRPVVGSNFADKKLKSLRSSIHSRDLILVPYATKMIKKYSSWFLDEYLCKMTSTDHLTESEAEKAHATWTCDDDKIMFIVLHREEYGRSHDEIAAMIGDVNIVIRRCETNSAKIVAELMLMIGEPQFRGRGLGRQMLLLFMRYALEKYAVTVFEARISTDNTASINLFLSCGFQKTFLDQNFNEHLMTLEINSVLRNNLIKETENLDYSVKISDSPA